MKLHQNEVSLNTSKATTKTMKRQAMDQEKIFTIHVSNLEFVWWILKNYCSNSKISKWPNTKSAKDWNRWLIKVLQKWTKRTWKFSTSFVIRKIQIKSILRYQHILMKVTNIVKTNHANYWWSCGATRGV